MGALANRAGRFEWPTHPDSIDQERIRAILDAAWEGCRPVQAIAPLVS